MFKFIEIRTVSIIVSINRIETSDNITWSAHHTKKQRSPVFEVSITSLLPLLRDQVHSVATIRHVMDKIKDTVTYLNPIQYPVIAADRPIYIFAKQIVALTRKVWRRQVLLLCLEVSVLKWWLWSPLEPSFKIVDGRKPLLRQEYLSQYPSAIGKDDQSILEMFNF